MSIYKNKVILAGNIGNDPEIQTSKENNKKFTTFSVATKDFFKNKEGEKTEKTEWHNIIVFKDSAVSVIEQYCKKGDQVFIEGSLSTTKWKDENEKTHYKTQVVVGVGDDFQFTSRSGKEEVAE